MKVKRERGKGRGEDTKRYMSEGTEVVDYILVMAHLQNVNFILNLFRGLKSKEKCGKYRRQESHGRRCEFA